MFGFLLSIEKCALQIGCEQRSAPDGPDFVLSDPPAIDFPYRQRIDFNQEDKIKAGKAKCVCKASTSATFQAGPLVV